MRASAKPCKLHGIVGCTNPACQRAAAAEVGRSSTVGTGRSSTVGTGRSSTVGTGRSSTAGTGVEGGEQPGVGGGRGSEGGSRTKAKLQPSKPLAFIRPKGTLEFKWLPGMPDPVSFVEITNITDSQISFKIKCSTPEAYRVEPHWGFVDAGEIATAAVTVQPGWMTKVASHKFLVAVIRAPDVFDDSSKTLKELWNSVPVDPTNYMEQKMTIRMDQLGPSENEVKERSDYGSKITQINKLMNNNQRLSSQLSALVMFQLLLGLVIVMCAAVIIIVFYLGHAQMKKGSKTH